MRALYVLTHGAKIHKHHNRLIVETDDREKVEVELADLATVVMLNTVQITTQALTAALRNRVELAIIDSRGRLLGQLTPPMPRNASLRLAQYSCRSNRTWVLEWSKQLVSAKVDSQAEVLRRWRYNKTGDRSALAVAEKNIRYLARRIPDCETIQQLMGVEGACAAAYWKGFAAALSPSAPSFAGRKFHPPPDPVNAALSLGYSLLTHLVTSAIDARGLDPWIGFFHATIRSRPALALDLVEPLRAPIVDRLVLRLFNRRVLQADDFSARSGAVFFSPQALKRFSNAWAKQVAADWAHKTIQSAVDILAAAITTAARDYAAPLRVVPSPLPSSADRLFANA